MCVIIVKKPGQKIDHDILAACHLANPDGFGVAWNKNKIIKRYKNNLKQDEIDFITRFSDALEKYPAIFHFRIATHGPKTQENCHPFIIGRNTVAFAHNGVFPGVDIPDKEWSDTRTVADRMNSWPEDILRRSLKCLEEWHGFGNRTAMLFPNGDIEKTGSWSSHKELQFSNLNWQSRGCYQFSSKTKHGTYQKDWNTGRRWDSTTSQWINASETKSDSLRDHQSMLIPRDGRWITKAEAKEFDEEQSKKNQRTRSLLPPSQPMSSTASTMAKSHVNSAVNSLTQKAKTDSAETAKGDSAEAKIGETGATESQSSSVTPKMTNPLHPLSSIDQVLIKVQGHDKGVDLFIEYYWDTRCPGGPAVRGMVHRGKLSAIVDEWLEMGQPVTVIEQNLTRNIKAKREPNGRDKNKEKENFGITKRTKIGFACD